MILQSLRWQPSHGYAVAQHIQQRSGHLLRIEEGSLYRAFQRPLKASLATASRTISTSTNRRIRTCTITGAGLRHLGHELSNFDRMLAGIRMLPGPARRPAQS
jgi:DNA-binding PadR family transcriptional regulator